MKNLLNKLPLRWIFRIAIAAFASYVTGLGFSMCILAYIGIMFLIRFSLNMLVAILGFAFMVCVFLALFLGLLALWDHRKLIIWKTCKWWLFDGRAVSALLLFPWAWAVKKKQKARDGNNWIESIITKFYQQKYMKTMDKNARSSLVIWQTIFLFIRKIKRVFFPKTLHEVPGFLRNGKQ